MTSDENNQVANMFFFILTLLKNSSIAYHSHTYLRTVIIIELCCNKHALALYHEDMILIKMVRTSKDLIQYLMGLYGTLLA